MTRSVTCGVVAAVRPAKNDDPRRYYRLTPFGRGVLKAEIARAQLAVPGRSS